MIALQNDTKGQSLFYWQSETKITNIAMTKYLDFIPESPYYNRHLNFVWLHLQAFSYYI